MFESIEFYKVPSSLVCDDVDISTECRWYSLSVNVQLISTGSLNEGLDWKRERTNFYYNNLKMFGYKWYYIEAILLFCSGSMIYGSYNILSSIYCIQLIIFIYKIKPENDPKRNYIYLFINDYMIRIVWSKTEVYTRFRLKTISFRFFTFFPKYLTCSPRIVILSWMNLFNYHSLLQL